MTKNDLETAEYFADAFSSVYCWMCCTVVLVRILHVVWIGPVSCLCFLLVPVMVRVHVGD